MQQLVNLADCDAVGFGVTTYYRTNGIFEVPLDVAEELLKFSEWEVFTGTLPEGQGPDRAPDPEPEVELFDQDAPEAPAPEAPAPEAPALPVVPSDQGLAIDLAFIPPLPPATPEATEATLAAGETISPN